MAQKLIQTQTQQQIQQQRLSQQQILQVKLLEMPLAELEQNIAAELDDNPALEETHEEPDDLRLDKDDTSGNGDDDDSEEQY
jgi:RNA polymerase sigma-54 factor